MKYVSGVCTVVIIFLLSFFTLRPFFHSGFFTFHDNTQVERVFEMNTSLRDGMFPVRWVEDLGFGYGYPLFNFYAPLAYYVGGFLTFIVNALIATKIMIATALFLSGLTMYFLAKIFWGKIGGLVAATFYLYAPYHSVQVYVRGDVAELWAYAFVPLAFYGLWQYFSTGKWRYLFLGSIGYAFVILSHNLTGMMVTPFFLGVLLLFSLISWKKKKKNVVLYVGFPILAFLFSAFYIVPVFTEMNYTNILSQVGGTADFHDHFVCLGQLWSSPWGYGGSAPGCTDGFTFKIGKLHILAVLGVFLMTPFLWKKRRREFWVIILGSCGFFFSCFLMLSQSSWLWEHVPKMDFFQYPWRFLIMTAFFSSFLSGSVIWYINYFIKKYTLPLVYLTGFLIMVMTILFYGKVFHPQNFVPVSSQDYTSKSHLRWDASKLTYEYMPKGFIIPHDKTEIVTNKVRLQKGNGIVTIIHQSPSLIQFQTEAKGPVVTLIRSAYFPTWNAYLDSTPLAFTPTAQGVVVTIPSGQHTISYVYHQTLIEIISDMLTTAGILLTILGIIYSQKKHLL